MICETCHGTRWVEVIIPEADGILMAGLQPCSQCGGQAFVHCCDGECEQPQICDTITATEH